MDTYLGSLCTYMYTYTYYTHQSPRMGFPQPMYDILYTCAFTYLCRSAQIGAPTSRHMSRRGTNLRPPHDSLYGFLRRHSHGALHIVVIREGQVHFICNHCPRLLVYRKSVDQGLLGTSLNMQESCGCRKTPLVYMFSPSSFLQVYIFSKA